MGGTLAFVGLYAHVSERVGVELGVVFCLEMCYIHRVAAD
eukprot:COSAG02_NODE_3209_length_7165_cov_31.071752_2_plen_40_part_00